MPATLTVHDVDPSDLIFDRAGTLEDIEVFNNQVLIGVYQREAESKTAGGIIITHKTTDEDRFQSKVGVILKIGPAAFTDFHNNPPRWFLNQGDMTIGDWVFYRPSSGWNVTLVSRDKNDKKAELLCRLVDDTAILGRITSDIGPDRVY